MLKNLSRSKSSLAPSKHEQHSPKVAVSGLGGTAGDNQPGEKKDHCR